MGCKTKNNEGVYDVVTQTNTKKDQTGRKEVVVSLSTLRRNLETVEEL